MRTSQLEHEYDSTLSDFGLRVANRFLYATMQKAGKKNFGLGDFYAMYAPEDGLPESERTHPGDEKLLDVTGWNRHYRTAQGSPRLIFGVPLEALTDHGRARLEAIVRMTPEERAADAEEFARNLTDHDVEEMHLALSGKPAMRIAQHQRHPDPGSPESEAFLEANRYDHQPKE